MAKPKVKEIEDKEFELKLSEKRHKELMTIFTSIREKLTENTDDETKVELVKALSTIQDVPEVIHNSITELLDKVELLTLSKNSAKWVFTLNRDSHGVIIEIIAEQE
jgi:hypothetical protein